MKNAPFAYQSQTGEWSIFIMNVENVSLKTESQSYKSLTKLKLMKTFISYFYCKDSDVENINGRNFVIKGKQIIKYHFSYL